MKTAEGWYQLVKVWHGQLLAIPVEELTTFEANILEDMNKHLPDMERPLCEGAGEIPVRNKLCPVCGGDGQIHVTSDQRELVECPVCGGTGEIPKEREGRV